MKLAKPNSVEWKSFGILMPAISFCICFVLFGNDWYKKMDYWQYGFFYTLVLGFFIWYADVLLTRFIHDTFLSYRDTLKRIAALVIKQLLIVTFFVTLIMGGLKIMQVDGFVPGSEKFWLSLSIGVAITLIAMVIWEGDFIFKQWKESLVEKEKYAQLSLQSEFDTLKSQVNPHFLFNCFNTLSSLITEDKQKAEVFLNELSKVYRYLLRNNEDGMSTLKNEIGFIESYFRLLKTRHGAAVDFQVETDKRYSNYLLPSLSLQMLVENAVKHNALSKNKPLTIEIFTATGNKLVVNNNIQPRSQKAPSGKVGLTNIRSKYELIKVPGFQVMEDGKYFTVVLPLIWDRAMGNNLSSVNKPPSV